MFVNGPFLAILHIYVFVNCPLLAAILFLLLKYNRVLSEKGGEIERWREIERERERERLG